MHAPALLRASILLATLALTATSTGCGGSVVKDDDGGGGSGAAGGSGGTASDATTGPGATTAVGTTGSSGSTVTTGTGGTCDDHQDCPGGLCDFVDGLSGTCIAACGEDGTCGPGWICDECATGSCGPCGDCVAGCVVAPPHTCDSHDDCADSETCVFSTGTCSATCGEDVGCIDGFTCDDCATSSCPGCEDCQPACVPKTDPGGCTEHEDCGDGLVCVFSGGYCSGPCDEDSDCGAKGYCDRCLTSSCPGCDDCRGACVYLP